jgi:uncharacterized protein
MPRQLKLDSRPIAYDSVVEAAASDMDGEIEDDIELADWRPLTPEPLIETPTLAFVDGVERRERRIAAEDGERPGIPGLLASYAAGAVLPGRSSAFRHLFVQRRAILANGAQPQTVRLTAHNTCIDYEPASSPGSDFESLEAALRTFRANLESQVVRALIVDGCDLVIVDGRLPPNVDSRVVGLIKTPHILPSIVTKHYGLLSALRAGQRSPVFVRRRSDRAYYSWFVCLRTPAAFDPALSGLALLEMDAPRREALLAAERTTALLPRYASEPYQDPRSPQNLLPVALLERELRHRLGDPELIARLLIETFYREAPSWQP